MARRKLKLQLLKWPSVDLKYAGVSTAYTEMSMVCLMNATIFVAPTILGSVYQDPQRRLAIEYRLSQIEQVAIKGRT